MERSMRMLLALAVMVSSIPFSISPAQAQPKAVDTLSTGDALPQAALDNVQRAMGMSGYYNRHYRRPLREILNTPEARAAIENGDHFILGGLIHANLREDTRGWPDELVRAVQVSFARDMIEAARGAAPAAARAAAGPIHFHLFPTAQMVRELDLMGYRDEKYHRPLQELLDTPEARAAIENGDHVRLGELMHANLREDARRWPDELVRVVQISFARDIIEAARGAAPPAAVGRPLMFPDPLAPPAATLGDRIDQLINNDEELVFYDYIRPQQEVLDTREAREAIENNDADRLGQILYGNVDAPNKRFASDDRILFRNLAQHALDERHRYETPSPAADPAAAARGARAAEAARLHTALRARATQVAEDFYNHDRGGGRHFVMQSDRRQAYFVPRIRAYLENPANIEHIMDLDVEHFYRNAIEDKAPLPNQAQDIRRFLEVQLRLPEPEPGAVRGGEPPPAAGPDPGPVAAVRGAAPAAAPPAAARDARPPRASNPEPPDAAARRPMFPNIATELEHIVRERGIEPRNLFGTRVPLSEILNEPRAQRALQAHNARGLLDVLMPHFRRLPIYQQYAVERVINEVVAAHPLAPAPPPARVGAVAAGAVPPARDPDPVARTRGAEPPAPDPVPHFAPPGPDEVARLHTDLRARAAQIAEGLYRYGGGGADGGGHLLQQSDRSHAFFIPKIQRYFANPENAQHIMNLDAEHLWRNAVTDKQAPSKAQLRHLRQFLFTLVARTGVPTAIFGYLVRRHGFGDEDLLEPMRDLCADPSFIDAVRNRNVGTVQRLIAINIKRRLTTDEREALNRDIEDIVGPRTPAGRPEADAAPPPEPVVPDELPLPEPPAADVINRPAIQMLVNHPGVVAARRAGNIDEAIRLVLLHHYRLTPREQAALRQHMEEEIAPRALPDAGRLGHDVPPPNQAQDRRRSLEVQLRSTETEPVRAVRGAAPDACPTEEREHPSPIAPVIGAEEEAPPAAPCARKSLLRRGAEVIVTVCIGSFVAYLLRPARPSAPPSCTFAEGGPRCTFTPEEDAQILTFVEQSRAARAAAEERRREEAAAARRAEPQTT